MDAATLRDLLTTGGGLRVLDVRTPGEFETMHIPGAYSVPLDLLREHRGELRAQCKSPRGGMLAWQHADAPVNRGRTRWDLERRERWIVLTRPCPRSDTPAPIRRRTRR